MRTWVLSSVLLLAAAKVQAQPCIPLQLVPAPWPVDRPRVNPQKEKLWSFTYAGGRYFAEYTESFPERTVSFGATSTDGTTFHLVELPPGGSSSFLTPVFYLRGFYYGTYNIGSELMRSSDGLHWQPLPVHATSINHPINWTGEQFVITGEFGEVWTSPDGEHWTYRAQVPNVMRPMFTGLADKYRLVVGGTQFRGFTDDYAVWHIEDALPGPSSLMGDVIGNGWFFTPFEKTREGQTWFPVAPPAYMQDVFFAGREFLGNGRTAQDLTEVSHVLTTADGESWSDRVLGEFVTVPPGLILTFGNAEAWDGKRLQFLMTSASRDAGANRIENYFFVSTSCADLGDPVMLPAVSHGDGANQTQWRTSLALHYPGPGAGEALVQWLPFGQENAAPQEKRVYFSTGESVELSDVVADLFGATGSGSLRVTSVGPAVVASARTYNDTTGGTLGQEIAPWRWDDGIGTNEEGWLAGLSDSGDLATGFRTNVGVQNLWVNEVEVEVVFRDAQARELGRRRALLKAFEGVQWYRPLKDSPAGTASALVRILNGDSRVAAWASRVDNRSGDGNTIRAWKLPWQGTVR